MPLKPVQLLISHWKRRVNRVGMLYLYTHIRQRYVLMSIKIPFHLLLILRKILILLFPINIGYLFVCFCFVLFFVETFEIGKIAAHIKTETNKINAEKPIGK